MIAQIGIATFGVVAIWLSQAPSFQQRRYACLFGLVSQPFWFWSAYTAQQWGILVLCLIYTVSWLRGFKTNWMNSAGTQDAVEWRPDTPAGVVAAAHESPGARADMSLDVAPPAPAVNHAAAAQEHQACPECDCNYPFHDLDCGTGRARGQAARHNDEDALLTLVARWETELKRYPISSTGGTAAAAVRACAAELRAVLSAQQNEKKFH